MKNFKTLLFITLAVFIFLPHLSLAVDCQPGFVRQNGECVVDPNYVPPFDNTPAPATCAANIQNIGDILCKIGTIINAIIPLLVALGVVYFVWGVVQFVIGGGEEAKTKGRDKMIYGIIGLVVIVGLWGLVTIVVNTFGIAGSAPDISNLTSGFTTQSTGSGGLCSIGNGSTNLQQLLDYVTCIIGKSVIPLIFALAVATFVWGVVQYVINSSEEAKKEKGRQFMIWGIIALTVMVCVWGLVAIVGKTFNVNNTGFIPQLKSQ